METGKEWDKMVVVRSGSLREERKLGVVKGGQEQRAPERGDPGTSFGKGSRENRWFNHVLAGASVLGLLTLHPSKYAPREPPRVPTLLFLKPTRNGLVRLSAL